MPVTNKYMWYIAAALTLIFIILAIFMFYQPIGDHRYQGSTVVFTNASHASIPVQVEVVDTEEEREYGLMNRTSLAPEKGMLFVFENSRVRSFWMKNTLIPLDMVFIGEDGSIVDINRNAIPLSETIYTSKEPCIYVVEVNGGFCKLRGIGVGDHASINIVNKN